MEKVFKKRVRVPVYLERDRYEAIKERCAPDAVSALCRHLLETYMDGETLKGSKARVRNALPEGVVKGSEVPKIGPKVCAGCGHARHKHCGFGTSCQDDRCVCSRFLEA